MSSSRVTTRQQHLLRAMLVLAHLNNTITNLHGQLLPPPRASTVHTIIHAPASATPRSLAVLLREVVVRGADCAAGLW
jgi:hypothetical protein